MSDYFPANVLIKILLKLPVKSLVRFTLVSKTWQAFITSTEFISTHLSRVQCDPMYSDRSRNLLIRYYSELDKKEHYELRPDNSCFLHRYSEVKFGLKSREGFNQIVGSCNGIVCLCDNLFGNFSTCPIMLWNPSIQKNVVLPLPKIEPSTKCFVLGFGFDVQRDDYKVVRILYYKGVLRKPVEAEIFSLRNKRWKTARDLVFKCYINDIGQSQVYSNGIVHWMAYQEKGNGDLENSILGFDCGDEEFIDTLLPEELADVGLHPNLHLSQHEGSLSLISYNKSFCRIWVMKEYGSAESWTQLYFFEWTQVYELPLDKGMAKVVGFRSTGELLVTSMVKSEKNNPQRSKGTAPGELISYNPLTMGVSKHSEHLGCSESFHVLDYVENLSLRDKHSQHLGCLESFHVLDYAETLCLLDYDLKNEETNYPIKKEEFVFSDTVKGEFDECFFQGEDYKEVHGFGKFEDFKYENNGDDFCMEDVNVDNEPADDTDSMEELDDSWVLVTENDMEIDGKRQRKW